MPKSLDKLNAGSRVLFLPRALANFTVAASLGTAKTSTSRLFWNDPIDLIDGE